MGKPTNVQRGRTTWEAISRWEREGVIIPLQRALAPIEVLSQLLGHSVGGEAILPLFASLYWCIDQHKCIAGIWLVPLSEIANGIVKWLTARPRPAWVDGRVRLLAWSSEFSFPSSHSQLAFAVAHFMVVASDHPEAVTHTPALPAYLYASAVALSRIHVGVHYPSDVAVGSAWGLATAAAYDRILPTLLQLLGRDPAVAGLFAALSTPGLIAAVGLIVGYRAVRKSRCSPEADRTAVAAAKEETEQWRRRICQGRYANRGLDPVEDPLGLYMGMLGVCTGLAFGTALKRYVPLSYPTSTRNALLRGVLGNAGLLTMFVGIAECTPKKPFALYQTLRFLRYALVPTYILLLAPPIFERAGI